jgi:hypothetical protein
LLLGIAKEVRLQIKATQAEQRFGRPVAGDPQKAGRDCTGDPTEDQDEMREEQTLQRTG